MSLRFSSLSRATTTLDSGVAARVWNFRMGSGILQIGESAERYDVSVNAVRYYERWNE